MLSGLSWLDRLLPVWIVLAMVLGVLIGSFLPQVMLMASHVPEGPALTCPDAAAVAAAF